MDPGGRVRRGVGVPHFVPWLLSNAIAIWSVVSSYWPLPMLLSWHTALVEWWNLWEAMRKVASEWQNCKCTDTLFFIPVSAQQYRQTMNMSINTSGKCFVQICIWRHTTWGGRHWGRVEKEWKNATQQLSGIPVVNRRLNAGSIDTLWRATSVLLKYFLTFDFSAFLAANAFYHVAGIELQMDITPQYIWYLECHIWWFN